MSPAELPAPETVTLAERLGVGVLLLEVVATTEPSPSIRRVTFRGDSLGGFDHEPGQDLMFTVPGEVRRRYTIRALDTTTGTVEIDVLLHSEGPGARWAADLAPGDRAEAIGPRGKVKLAEGADWHLFVGDGCFEPAVHAMTTALPATAVILRILTENDTPVASRDLEALALPAGVGHAYIGGELENVAALKRVLLDRGLSDSQVSAKSYWRRGQGNAAHGEPLPPTVAP